jgi:hypothetical protein
MVGTQGVDKQYDDVRSRVARRPASAAENREYDEQRE